ncbi:MAG: DUF1512 domain-containing protein [Thaumarchaeota archaeon]|nr:DUF1512 domain-containing protein [Nitrososphaerota archaeon]
MTSPLATSPFSGIDFSTLLSLASYMLFFVFIVYGQRIQYYITANSVGKGVNRLNLIRQKAREETISYFSKIVSAGKGVSERIDEFLDYVTIMPVDIDPKGLVQKIGHVANTSDERLRGEVKNLLPNSDLVAVSVAQNLLEVSSALNQIHKVVRHFYLTGKKTNSYITLIQLQMIMPQLIEIADALGKAIYSIELGQPIGDGAGPLVASRFLTNVPKEPIAKDTVMGVTEFKGRTLYVMKAEGPAGYVGQPGVAMEKIVEEMKVPLNAVIMVDAALKLEGEKTGEIAEGVGAAIGGLGVEKFEIEEVTSKHNIPVYAVLIKLSEVEAITAMRKEIADAAEKVYEIVQRIIEQKTKEGDKVLLAGIGNTLGVGQ